jgi:L-rhamnose mutarotase
MSGKAQRMGMVIGVKPERLAEYKALHAEPWPDMDAALSAANIQNYSIYLREPENLLFGYWEYLGTDYAADMKVLGELAVTKRWLALTDPCQMKLKTAAAGEWWSMMPEVYHLD